MCEAPHPSANKPDLQKKFLHVAETHREKKSSRDFMRRRTATAAASCIRSSPSASSASEETEAERLGPVQGWRGGLRADGSLCQLRFFICVRLFPFAVRLGYVL